MKLKDKLESMHACSEAIKWVGNRGIKTAWRDCPRGDWMLWIAGRLEIDHKLLVLAACDCAETALKYAPDDDRPAKCIEVTRKWCEGKATTDDVRAAQCGAYAAAYVAYAAADVADVAVSAAYAAADVADAAYAAADVADVADVAVSAAYAASYASYAAYAARKSAHKLCADLVRARIPYETIKALL